MRVLAFSLCFMRPEIVLKCLGQSYHTMGRRPDQWLLIPHFWPIETRNHEQIVNAMSHVVGATVANPEKNIGGTGGANWAIAQLKPEPDDLILWLDGDSWPLKHGWLNAMVDVMHADPTIATVSLLPGDWPKDNPWYSRYEERFVGGQYVRSYDHPQAFSVCLWRANFALPEIKGEHQFYGQIERPAFEKAQKLGMASVWLSEFEERCCAHMHEPLFENWKADHVGGRFAGNFDEYLEKVRGEGS